MKFPKEALQDLVCDKVTGNLVVISNEIDDAGRWTIYYRMVFEDKDTGKFYVSYYGKAATEHQSEYPYEYEEGMVECSEVYPVEKTVIVYE